MATSTQDSPISRLRDYFQMRASDFMREWKELTDQDKEDLKKGIMDGSFTY
jgi:hypothetical protein